MEYIFRTVIIRCIYCYTINTIEHHLFECVSSTKIWNGLESWIYNNLDIKLKLRDCEVLFGIPYHNSIANYLYSFILKILYHSIEREPKRSNFTFFEIFQEIETKIEIITLTNRLNDREDMEVQTQLRNIL